MQAYPHHRPGSLGFFWIWIAVLGGVVVLALLGAWACGKHSRAALPYVKDVQLSQLTVGDCLDGMRSGVTVTRATTVPCWQPHDGEIIYRFELDGSWPGATEADFLAGDRCDRETQHRLTDPDRFTTSYLYPNTPADWDASRLVTCLVRDRNHLKLSAPLFSSGG